MYRILLIWETCIIYRIRVHCAVDPWLARVYYFETESRKRMRNITRISCRLSRFSIFIILLLVSLRILIRSCTVDDAHIRHPLTHNRRELSQESFKFFLALLHLYGFAMMPDARVVSINRIFYACSVACGNFYF